jgi:alkanesulfonate monooxygenase SsuD/methylene tetrahydromethanopterin reductase-like flavin-dependent oxidoreductase (luciferase family)
MVRRRGGRRPLRVLLVGDPEDVKATIGNLHRRGFAEAGAWSKPIARSRLSHVSEQLLPNPHPDDVITILTKYMN